MGCRRNRAAREWTGCAPVGGSTHERGATVAAVDAASVDRSAPERDWVPALTRRLGLLGAVVAPPTIALGVMRQNAARTAVARIGLGSVGGGAHWSHPAGIAAASASHSQPATVRNAATRAVLQVERLRVVPAKARLHTATASKSPACAASSRNSCTIASDGTGKVNVPHGRTNRKYRGALTTAPPARPAGDRRRAKCGRTSASPWTSRTASPVRRP